METDDHGTITITAPSFRAATGMLRLLAEQGNTTGKAFAWEEITRWATMLDNAAAAEKRAAEDEAKAPAPATDEATRSTFIAAARQAFGSDEITVDDDAVLSEGDGGAWVQSWLWVSNAEAGIEEEPETRRCDFCHDDPATITVERATVAEGEAPELHLCTNCYADVEFD